MSRVSTPLSDAACLAALRSCRLFESLRPDDLRRIADFARLRRVARGEFLFREGEPTLGFYIVRSGTIHVHRIGPDGREKGIHLFRAGESLAEAMLAEGLGYPSHACAVEPSVVVVVPRGPTCRGYTEPAVPARRPRECPVGNRLRPYRLSRRQRPKT